MPLRKEFSQQYETSEKTTPSSSSTRQNNFSRSLLENTPRQGDARLQAVSQNIVPHDLGKLLHNQAQNALWQPARTEGTRPQELTNQEVFNTYVGRVYTYLGHGRKADGVIHQIEQARAVEADERNSHRREYVEHFPESDDFNRIYEDIWGNPARINEKKALEWRYPQQTWNIHQRLSTRTLEQQQQAHAQRLTIPYTGVLTGAKHQTGKIEPYNEMDYKRLAFHDDGVRSKKLMRKADEAKANADLAQRARDTYTSQRQ